MKRTGKLAKCYGVNEIFKLSTTSVQARTHIHTQSNIAITRICSRLAHHSHNKINSLLCKLDISIIPLVANQKLHLLQHKLQSYTLQLYFTISIHSLTLSYLILPNIQSTSHAITHLLTTNRTVQQRGCSDEKLEFSRARSVEGQQNRRRVTNDVKINELKTGVTEAL